MSMPSELADGINDKSRGQVGAGNAKAAANPYRWIVLTIAFAAFFITFLDRLAWASANLFASQTLNIPIAALGVFVTAFYVGYVTASALAGFVTDRIGARLVLFLALTPLAASTFAFGLSSSFTTGLILQGLMGLCAGADYAACIKLVARWFDRAERGRALGFFSTAPSVGVACANAAFPVLLGILDWRSLYMGLGGLTALIAIICFTLLADAPRHNITEANANKRDPTEWRRGLVTLSRDRDLLLIALAGFGASWGTWGFAFWATALMVRGYQLSPVDAGLVALIFGVAAAISKPIYGWLSDLLGGKRRNLVIYDLLAFATMLMVFGLMTTKQGFLVAAPLLGLTAVVYSPLLAAMITEKVEPRFTATATGVINALWQLGSVIVPTIVGMVFAATGSFLMAFAVLAAGPLVGCLCMFAVRETSSAVTRVSGRQRE
jgi:sugar phosphate permease